MNKKLLNQYFGCAAVAAWVCAAAPAQADGTTGSPYRSAAQKIKQLDFELEAYGNRRAKNVILFVGDGMGVSTVTAARILEGQNKGGMGEENSLSFEEFRNLALVKTYSVNQQTSDSAPTATAMVTGDKTNDGAISVGPEVGRTESDYSKIAPYILETVLEQAEARGFGFDRSHHARDACG